MAILGVEQLFPKPETEIDREMQMSCLETEGSQWYRHLEELAEKVSAKTERLNSRVSCVLSCVEE